MFPGIKCNDDRWQLLVDDGDATFT
jgi:hypothetical protein